MKQKLIIPITMMLLLIGIATANMQLYWITPDQNNTYLDTTNQEIRAYINSTGYIQNCTIITDGVTKYIPNLTGYKQLELTSTYHLPEGSHNTSINCSNIGGTESIASSSTFNTDSMITFQQQNETKNNLGIALAIGIACLIWYFTTKDKIFKYLSIIMCLLVSIYATTIIKNEIAFIPVIIIVVLLIKELFSK